MLYFCIPLRSKKSSRCWKTVENLINGTIASIFNQSSDNFKIFVACHDKPKITSPYDDRLEFIHVNFPPPSDTSKQMLDKGLKCKTLACRLFQLGGGYMMFVDADDLLNKHLVSYVEKDQHPNGYVFTKGYEYDYQKKIISKTFRFNKLCGTSHIFNLKSSDLPANIEDKHVSYSELFSKGHYHYAKNFSMLGRPLKKLPFAGAVYVINSNENHSQVFNNIGFKRKIIRLFTPSFSPAKKLINTFNIM